MENLKKKQNNPKKKNQVLPFVPSQPYQEVSSFWGLSFIILF